MENLQAQKVALSDLEKLRDISIRSFTETFSSVNTPENMAYYLANSLSLAKLTEEFNTAGSAFYFAVLNNDIIGYLKLNTGAAQTELKITNSLEIERIYVLKEFHGKKAGQFLYEKAIRVALEKAVDFVWLGVWEENHRAIAFYSKNGFVAFDKHPFYLGDDEQIDIMMKKVL